ncbi:hypothetical protein ABKV19_025236 [Rosa sericea]
MPSKPKAPATITSSSAASAKINSISEIMLPQLSNLSIVKSASASLPSEAELQKFGLSDDDLRDFMKGIWIFKCAPFRSNSRLSLILDALHFASRSSARGVRKDLTEWQERHTCHFGSHY